MELQSEEGDEMPLPLNSTYGGHGHMIHHNHNHNHHDHHHSPPPPPSSISHNHIIIPSSAPPPPPLPSSQIISIPSGPLIIAPSSTADDVIHHPPPPPSSFKKLSIRYRECLKNHAAGMGGNATDGCGEFMPSGDDGTLEALTCSACSCHRNFHRKEIDGGDPSPCDSCFHNPIIGRKLFLGHHHHHHKGGVGGYHISSLPPPPPHQMIMSYNIGGGGAVPSESDEQETMARAPQMKKRFRTKFSQEQKEKMLSFAERVGWKMQKQEEGVVQQFCQEIGVKRRVLKVWMHNNKHTLAKNKTASSSLQSSHDHHHQLVLPQQQQADDHTTLSLDIN